MKRISLVLVILAITLHLLFPIHAAIRPPAVAGSFYPDNPEELTKTVEGLLASATPSNICGKKSQVIGLIVPHAGYVYSGPTAAVAFKSISGQQFDRIYLLGVDHHSRCPTVSIWSNGAFDTPLGPVPVDASASLELLRKAGIFVDEPLQHTQEHSLEVELPFLIKTFGAKPSVFVSVGGVPENGFILGKELIKLLSVFQGRVLIIASSDWSHYFDSVTAEKLDKVGLKSALEINPEQLLADCRAGTSELCGLNGVLALLTVMRAANSTAKLLERSDSSKSSNDSTRVVGYAAVLFEGDLPKIGSNTPSLSVNGSSTGRLENFSNKEVSMQVKRETLSAIRKTLETVLAGGGIPEIEFTDPRFQEKCGVFVTLKKNGDLRGCIGFIEGIKPLSQGIQEMAVAAATEDPRFSPVSLEELGSVTIEVSLLSPLIQVKDHSEIVVGRDGVLLRRFPYSGVFLPQVATEQGWDRDTFLDQLCLKARLPVGSHKSKEAQLFRFTADVFGEEELRAYRGN